MSQFESPASEGIYCLTCRYELRGLTSNRCPECGRFFDPKLASTYTRYPSLTKEVENRVYQSIRGFLREPAQAQRFSTSLASLLKQQSRLQAENAELRSMLAAMEQLLIEKGIVSEQEIRDRLDRLGLFEPVASTEQIARWLNQMVSEPAPASDEDDSVEFDPQVESYRSKTSRFSQ